MSQHSVKVTISAWGDCFDLQVEADYTPAETETRDCPASCAEAEILSVKRDGREISDELSDTDWEYLQTQVEAAVDQQIEDRITEAAIDRYEDYQDAGYMYDARRDQ